MESSVRPQIHARMTVNETVRANPATLAVFAQAGIDTCCGGALPVEEAARRHGIELDALLRALTAAAG
jgi:iron-sulfur cluster repair protein YtfE (RIC family)